MTSSVTSTLSPTKFFFLWFSLGLQSFGGGAATFSLMRDLSVNKQKWVSADEFNEIWAMVQLAPGINLLALTVLIGKKARGTSGILLATVGLLLPSVAITILLSATYTQVQNTATVKSALRGIFPAIIALSLLTGYDMAVAIFKSSARDGRLFLYLSWFLTILCATTAFKTRLPVVAILLASGAIYSLFNTGMSRNKSESHEHAAT